MAGISNTLDERPEPNMGLAESVMKFMDNSLPELQAQIVRRKKWCPDALRVDWNANPPAKH